ncbi:MAG: hypothetical protein JNK89_00470 [Saprospiraceae bacterium]|nr:hypothetical protein [Saprospiraceae bacterium]
MLAAFEQDDRLNAQFWLDSLSRLESELHRSMYWDERWLLYIWLEQYPTLFTEVQQFSQGAEEQALYKIPPTPDSLFTRLDNRLYENQAYLFDQVRKAWLNTEERAFSSLLISYLLRLSSSEPAASEFDDALKAFLKTYPSSSFAPFIRMRMFNRPPAAKWAIGGDLMFSNGNWTENLEGSLRPMFGVDLAFFYWRHRLNAGLRLNIGGQKLANDIEENLYIWPKDDPSTFFCVELEAGYDLYNKPRLRIYPTLGGGFSSIHAPEDEENSNPDYYQNFRFNGWHWTAALQADVKFKPDANSVSGSYTGVRIRLGRRWLNLDDGNPAFRGNMFFISAGFTIFSRQAEK